jgi:hypothetical protein
LPIVPAPITETFFILQALIDYKSMEIDFVINLMMIMKSYKNC